MKKNKIILVSLGLLLVLFSATVVYAKAMSYYGITTIGYGNINYAQSNGPGQWTPSRYEYTTRPYYFMNQLGATYWQVRNTCDGVTNSFSIWSTSGTYLIANNVRSMGDSIVTRMDHPCFGWHSRCRAGRRAGGRNYNGRRKCGRLCDYRSSWNFRRLAGCGFATGVDEKNKNRKQNMDSAFGVHDRFPFKDIIARNKMPRLLSPTLNCFCYSRIFSSPVGL